MAHDDTFNRIDEVFRGALRVPPDERSAWIEQACGGDDRLRVQVIALLAEDDRTAGALDAPVLGDGPDSPVQRAADAAEGAGPDAEHAGGRIGPYQLLERLGEGGFGVVWMADQSEPVNRRVALKVIKFGMDTRQVIARFEAERQALAMMDHPHIATALDAGATEQGRPYFVMELCDGTAITDYCREHRLDVGARLDLFGQVCRAIEHAHQKGVIHRDIKPGNVLVETRDGRPFARVIDFGIAKATEARLTERTYFTEHRQMIGTPEYMSPEQAEGLPDVDTRTDVYGLGVLLYELLTGSTPHDTAELRAAGWGGIARMIREVTPPTPSTRRTRAGGAKSGGLAADGHPAPRRGELDWIVMKAIAVERARRYQSAGALAEDVAAFLDGRPVAAAPPSRVYRMRTFVRRNRGLVAATSILAATLLIGIAGTSWSLLQARDAAADASARARELEQVVQFQSARLVDVVPEAFGARIRDDVLGRLPANTDPAVPAILSEVGFTDVGLGSLKADILQPALDAARDEFADQPLIQARMFQSIADSARDLGLMEFAEGPQSEALELRTAALGEEHPDVLESMHRLVIVRLERSRYDEIEPMARRSAELHRRILGDVDATADAVGAHGAILRALQRLDEAFPLYREAHERTRAVHGEDAPEALVTLNNMAFIHLAMDRPDEAEAAFRDVYERRERVLGPDDSATLGSALNLANVLRRNGQFEDAEPLFLRAVEGHRRIHGSEHPRTLSTMGNLGVFQLSMGRFAEAEATLREAVEGHRRTLGPTSLFTVAYAVHHGHSLALSGRIDEARALLHDLKATARAEFGPDSPQILRAELGLAIADREGGDRDGAVARLEALRDASAAQLGEESRYTREIERVLATTREGDAG